MAHLSLKFLGGFDVTLDGEAVMGFDSNKVRALLAYLAVESDRAHRRESLAALLWPDYPAHSARTTLRRTLYSLRNVIRDRVADPPFLFIHRDTLQFNAESDYWLDVDMIEQMRRHVDTVPTAQRIDAIGLYTGDFLEGFTLSDALGFDDWASVTRERLRRQALDLLGVLVDRLAAEGDPERALTYARRRVELEPWLEDAQRQLIYVLAATGQRSAALRQYRRCVHVLNEELRVDPAVETMALVEAIRMGKTLAPHITTIDRAARIAPRVRDLHPPAFLHPTAKPSVMERSIFIGREPELARLDDILDAALDGHGQVAFIIGGPGRGKTALMRAFAERAMAAHPELLVIRGACNIYSGTGDAYLPFREALAMLTGGVESRWRAGVISRDHARRLWSTLPKTLEMMVDHGPYVINTLVRGADVIAHAREAGLDHAKWMPELHTLAHRVEVQDLPQRSLFQQVANVLQTVTGDHPLVLALDDLQWIDRGSVSLLFHLGRRLEGHRILILGAYRPEEVDAGDLTAPHPLAKLLNEFRRTFGDVWVDLREADANEGEAFVRALIDTERNRLDDSFRTSLYALTGGHPLFTIEFLRALQARGDLQREADGFWIQGEHLDWTTTPARIEAVIEERLRHLDRQERGLLEVASVDGETFTAQVLARVRGLEDQSVLRTLSQRLRDQHRLVQENGEVYANGRYLTQFRFAHALFREYLYRTMSKGEQRWLHSEIASALERLYPKDDDRIVPQLAHHFDRAGHTREAMEYAIRAGERAHAIYANDEARRYFNRALDLIETIRQNAQVTERDQVSHLTALRGLGALCLDIGNASDAEHYLSEAVRMGRQLALGPQEIAILYHQLGGALWWQGKYRESLRIGKKGLALFEDDETSLGAALMNERVAAGCAVTGQWARAWELTHRTAGFIEDLPYSSTLKTAYTHIIFKCTMSKDVDGVRYWIAAFKRQARAHSDLLGMATAHYDTARLMGNIGDHQGTIDQTRQARDLWRRTGDLKRESWAWRELAFRHLIAGNIEAAARSTAREQHLTETVGTRRDVASGCSLMGRIAFCNGAIEQALEAFTEANAKYEAIHSLEGSARTSALLGRIHLDSGDRREAQACFERAMQRVAGITCEQPLQWQLVPLLLPILSGLDEALDDAAVYHVWIEHYLASNPQFEGMLQQWTLDPVLEGCAVAAAPQVAGFEGIPISDSDWTWVDPFHDCRYVVREGLTIEAATPRHLWGMNLSTPRWLRHLPDGATHINVQVTCKPARDDRPGIGGLLLWKDKQNYLWLERGRFGPGDIALGGCIDNRDRVIGRGRLPGEPVTLRLKVTGDRVDALCSQDEETWASVGHATFPLDETVRIGVHALGIGGVIDQITGMIDQIAYLGAYPEGTAIRFTSFKMSGS